MDACWFNEFHLSTSVDVLTVVLVPENKNCFGIYLFI